MTDDIDRQQAIERFRAKRRRIVSEIIFVFLKKKKKSLIYRKNFNQTMNLNWMRLMMNRRQILIIQMEIFMYH